MFCWKWSSLRLLKDLIFDIALIGEKKEKFSFKKSIFLVYFGNVSFLELFLLNPLELSAQRSNFNVVAATYFKLKLPEEEKRVFGFSL